MKPKPVAWIRSGDDQLSLVKGKSDGYMIWKPLYSEAFVRQQQAEIESLKRPNNVVGVPCDELKKMQDRLAHLEKMVVWYQDITMTGINSEEYENGFWDAVGFVKQHQVKDMK